MNPETYILRLRASAENLTLANYPSSNRGLFGFALSRGATPPSLRICRQSNSVAQTVVEFSSINQVLNAKPSGATPEAQLASLQKTISQARALSADLAKLAG